MKKRVMVVLTLSAAVAFGAAVTVTETKWQAVNNDWNGSWDDDTGHWELGPIGEKQKGRIPLKSANKGMEIVFPQGEYSNAGEWLLRGEDASHAIVMNGTNTTYLMCGSTQDVHSTRPWAIQNGNYVLYCCEALTDYSKAALTFKNFKFTYSNTDGRQVLDFDGGVYNFYDADGTQQASVFKMFQAYAPGDPTYRDVLFRNGAELRVNTVQYDDVVASGKASTNRVVFDGGKCSVAGSLLFPCTSTSFQADTHTRNELTFDNGAEFSFKSMSVGRTGASNKTYVVTFDHGSTGTQTGLDFHSYDGHAIFNILNGSDLTLTRSVYMGDSGYGTTDVNVVSAAWKSQGSTMYMGPRSSTWYGITRANLNLTNSTFKINANMKYTSGGIDIVDSEIYGDRNFYMDDPALNFAKFHANGGRYRLTGNTNISGDLLHDWDEATIGERGFEVQSDYAVTMGQDFANEPGKDGFLLFTGTGTKTLTATNTTVSRVVVAGGTVAFSAGANYASTLVVTHAAAVTGVQTNGLTGIILGTAATTGSFNVDFTKTVDVDGEIVLIKPVFTAANNPQRDIEYTVFLADSASETTLEKWNRLAAFFTLPEGCGAVFEVKTVGQRLAFTVTVRTASTREETLASGTEMRSADISVAAIDTVKTTVGTGAELTLSGGVGDGRFEKWGEGKVILSNPSNTFIGGIGLYEGVLSATCAGALGFTGNNAKMTLSGGAWELDFSEEDNRYESQIDLASTVSSSNAVVLNVKKDATVKAWNATAGCFIKRGSGTLTVEADSAASLTVSLGKGVPDRDTRLDPAQPLDFNDDGTYKSGAYAGFTLLEGEMRLKGQTSVTVNAKYSFAVAGPATKVADNPKQAGLVVDGITLDTRNTPGGLAFATGITLGNNTPETMHTPYIVVTNGAHLQCHNFFGAYNSQGTAATRFNPSVLVEGSTLSSASWFYPNRSGNTTVCPTFVFRNGAKCYPQAIQLDGSALFEFDRSEFAMKSDGTPGAIVQTRDISSDQTNAFTFANGSVFRCNRFYSVSKRTIPTHYLTFDDSEWDPGSGDFTFAPSNLTMEVVMRGKGIILSPAGNVTHTWLYYTTGDGGFRKRGEGTAVLSSTNALYTGVTVVEAGTLDLDGSVWSARTFTGAGTIANGRFVNPVFQVSVTDGVESEAWLTVASDVTFEGKVTVDLGRTEPGLAFDKTKTFPVLAYSGSAPDVSGWKLVGTGIAGNVCGEFSAAGGMVSCRLADPAGLLIIMR